MFSKNNNFIEIYTDGSCSGNPGPGGWASVILCDDKQYISSGYENHTTNNRMEILAAINGLKQIKQLSKIKLFTDSNYLKNGITIWINAWKKNNWINSQKKPVANRDLWEDLDLINNKIQIDWIWVKGHENNIYNNLADEYAVLSMKEQKKFTISSIINY